MSDQLKVEGAFPFSFLKQESLLPPIFFKLARTRTIVQSGSLKVRPAWSDSKWKVEGAFPLSFLKQEWLLPPIFSSFGLEPLSHQGPTMKWLWVKSQGAFPFPPLIEEWLLPPIFFDLVGTRTRTTDLLTPYSWTNDNIILSPLRSA